MVEDLHTGVTSDVNGFYTLPNMKPGTYKVKVSYVGYSPKTYVIKLVGKNVERNIVLSEGNELKEVVVNGAFYGQRKALQMQKENMGVTNVVSADQVGKFPDSNIGDALKRINGINVQSGRVKLSRPFHSFSTMSWLELLSSSSTQWLSSSEGSDLA